MDSNTNITTSMSISRHSIIIINTIIYIIIINNNNIEIHIIIILVLFCLFLSFFLFVFLSFLVSDEIYETLPSTLHEEGVYGGRG
eukprot:m.187570 g.187570  ORF g.187570 m.187570 type:complete len:85 (+) comp32310_c6_seq2:949-1203(+)